jgi:O-antigen/teichoic acid export membrane protein
MAAIVLPAAAVVALFPHELLLLWTRNPTAARIAAPIAVLLAIGTAMNSLVALACDVQWAYGWTSLGFYKNLIAVALLAPLIVVLAAKFGAVGAASVWVILNAAYLLVEIPVMHRRLLRGEMLLFYLADVGRPLVAVLAVVVIGRFAISRGGFVGIELLLSLVVIGALGTCAAALAVPGLRRWIVRRPTELGVAPGA